jgi:serine/threonine-protein kinase HipA
MPRRRTRSPLNVLLNGQLVGQLRRESGGAIEFQYDQSWLDRDYAIPVSLSLPLREDRYSGDRVIAVFDNLLPDNDPVRRRLGERAGAQGYDAYSLLAAVGRDCVGALQFMPDGEEPGPPGRISARAVSDEEIATIVSDLEQRPLGIAPDEDFRISIAGTQEKTALLRWKGRWHVPHGPTATTHILKPQIGRLPNGIDLSHSVENEHLCMKLTAALGLPAARTDVYDFAGKRVLVVERFDRLWTRDKRLIRRPQEDCCQALSVPPPRKYEADGGPGIRRILQLLKGSDEPEADRNLFLKAQILFWLLAATDGHAKNFSLHLLPAGRFRMAPLYDIMSAQPALDAGQIRRNKMKLAMAVGTNRHYGVENILPRHFIQTADLCGLSETVVEETKDELSDAAPAAIESALSGLPQDCPGALAESIVGGFRKRLGLLQKFFRR